MGGGGGGIVCVGVRGEPAGRGEEVRGGPVKGGVVDGGVVDDEDGLRGEGGGGGGEGDGLRGGGEAPDGEDDGVDAEGFVLLGEWIEFVVGGRGGKRRLTMNASM